MACDTLHLTHDMWHMTHGGRWTFSKNVPSLTLTVWEWKGVKDLFKKSSKPLHYKTVEVGEVTLQRMFTSLHVTDDRLHVTYGQFFLWVREKQQCLFKKITHKEIEEKNLLKNAHIMLHQIYFLKHLDFIFFKIPHMGDTKFLDRCR